LVPTQVDVLLCGISRTDLRRGSRARRREKVSWAQPLAGAGGNDPVAGQRADLRGRHCLFREIRRVSARRLTMQRCATREMLERLAFVYALCRTASARSRSSLVL